MKKILIVVAILVVLVGGGAWWAYSSLGVVVKYALEHYGPEVLGVSVQVRDATISPRDGRGVVRGLEIGTPTGFNAPRTARVGEIRVDLDPGTLSGPIVRIHSLVVESPVITYERGDHGTNLEAIQRNIQAYIAGSGGPSSTRPAQAKSGKRKYVVDRIALTGAKVTMTNPGLHGQGITFDLPDLELRDVGKRQGGLTPSEIGNVVVDELQARIAQKLLTHLDLLRKGGLGGALDALKSLLR